MADLLIELFSEEIPARMQARAAEDLQKLVTNALVEAGLTYAHASAHATPRRLALALEGLPAETKPVREERKGPRADAPEKALEGFLRSTGLTRDQLEERDDKKGKVLFAVIEKPGRPAAEIVAEALEGAIRNFPWPKSMRWGAGSLRWVRPLQSILCILTDESGATVVPVDIDGIRSGDVTHGHRFMGARDLKVNNFDDYAAKLEANKVLLRAEDRAEKIRHDAEQLAFAQGLEVVEDRGLLAEVAGLVEWPVVLMGEIADDFLGLPPEVLQTSMKEHQKFFSVKNPATGRIERFITVANIEAPDHGATILAGNKKVLFARLSDAKFFWENDLRTPMVQMAEKLENVTFHAQLGSQAQRIARIASLAGLIAPMVGADSALAERAARLAKADLSSEMVYEFPELQGIMGRYYAEEAGEAPEVAAACAGHYAPLGPSDDVPTAPVTMAVSLAEKLDILTGFWAIDEKPTGSKDPYALRRAALGVLRIVLENGLRVRLSGLIDAAQEQLMGQGSGHIDAAARADLLSFFADRLKVHLKGEGIRHDVIAACMAEGEDDFAPLVARARALQGFLGSADGENLLQGWRRAANILAAEEKKDGVEYSLDPIANLAEEGAEKALFAALDAAAPKIEAALKAEDWDGAMTAMAELRAPIDAFFTDVVVNAENQTVRRNRLCLLNRIRAQVAPVADFGALEG
ncbi:glycine--tRNA ligase subunit beta [Rhodovulum sp. DZ06]|uniref:glycine--tRNA ligase subunit beta n=1 Tax=Rhodovulum sp. DZ06 TaxID=3425126 RepID=UPI003D33E849